MSVDPAARTVTAADRDRPGVPRGFEVGAVIGRYRVVRRIGEGGMGVVYEAHDAELDRRVALKVVRYVTADLEAGRSRLVREARAMARLAHENVVPVFDAGVLGEDVYVTMELVAGQSLDHWCEGRVRTWRELLDVFIQAGRGLVAAHDAGIVHRDIKPSNLLVGVDGRVRVADFGLARSAADATEDAGSGTPAFMAPEQRTGAVADAVSDQYSFALAFRTLLGDAARIPSALRRVLVRATSVDREARFGSMAELVRELERIRSRDRRRRGALLGGLAVVATGVGGYAFAASRTEPAAEPCAPAHERLAGVWDPTLRATMASRFASVDPVIGATTAGMAGPHLDRQTTSWLAERSNACRQERNPELLARRYACLDRVLDETRALTELFASTGSQAVVRGAVRAVLDLPGAESCRDQLALETAMPLPADPAARDQIGRLRQAIDRALAHRRTGDYQAGLALAAPLPDQARALGYAPVIAEALGVAAELEDWGGDATKAEALYREAMLAAGRAGDDARLAAAAGARIFVLGALGEGERAIEAGTAAEAQAIRSRSAAIEGLVHNNLGATYFQLDRHELAGKELAHALTLREAALGPDHPLVASTLSNLGAVRRVERKFDEAEALHRRALDIKRRVLGPDHPEVAQSLTNLAAVLEGRGDAAGAYKLEQDALARLERAMGPTHVKVAESLNNLGSYAATQGKWKDAAAVLERAATLFRAALPPGHPNLARALASLGEAYVHLARGADAVPVLEEAVQIHVAANSPPVDLAHAQFALASALVATRRELARACELVTHARDAYRTAENPSWLRDSEALRARACKGTR